MIPAKRPAANRLEAYRRYKLWFKTDPFPRIPASLLNSADIYNYVCATGMMFPFDSARLKSSSYAIHVGSKVISWTGEGQKDDRNLAPGESFVLQPNSITFLTTEEVFCLPDHVAMRFNLKINNVHRGILLGTGPLVDPGFEGNLLIPLHNLTTNPYTLQRGETFVWVEFTKVSPNERWDERCSDFYAEYGLEGEYKEFPRSKKRRSEWTYLDEASKGPIRSSIPDALAQAERSAREASDQAQKISDRAYADRRNSLIAGFLSLAALVVVLFTVGSDIRKDIATVDKSGSVMRSEFDNARRQFDAATQTFAREIAVLRDLIVRYKEGELESLKQDLELMRRRLEEMEKRLPPSEKQ